MVLISLHLNLFNKEDLFLHTHLVVRRMPDSLWLCYCRRKEVVFAVIRSKWSGGNTE